MRRRHDLLRKGIATATGALVLALSVAVPLLEANDVVHEPVAESQHEPGACHTGHDHTVCTQVAANAAASTEAVVADVGPGALRLAIPSLTIPAASAAFPDGHPARAPPRA